jgi:nucleoside 2-deoxyribosyltransferase
VTTLYLAGPMTGYPRWNFDEFERGAALLRAAGYEVVSPAEIELAEGFDPDAPVAEFTLADLHRVMRRDIEAVLAVDGVALLPNWENSKGAQLEAEIGRQLGLPVYTVGLFLTTAELEKKAL